jgi:hypothetical protein
MESMLRKPGEGLLRCNSVASDKHMKQSLSRVFVPGFWNFSRTFLCSIQVLFEVLHKTIK